MKHWFERNQEVSIEDVTYKMCQFVDGSPYRMRELTGVIRDIQARLDADVNEVSREDDLIKNNLSNYLQTILDGEFSKEKLEKVRKDFKEFYEEHPKCSVFVLPPRMFKPRGE